MVEQVLDPEPFCAECLERVSHTGLNGHVFIQRAQVSVLWVQGQTSEDTEEMITKLRQIGGGPN